MDEKKWQGVVKNAYLMILLIIFGGVVLHAPLSVFLSSLMPSYVMFFKAWKEILLFLAIILILYLLIQKKRLKLLYSPLLILIGCYGLLHLVLALLIKNSFLSIVAGLMIDLRYLVYFCLVYIAIRLWPDLRGKFVRVFAYGALIVAIFAVLQVFVLPKNILEYIGYGRTTIAPYLTVDQNKDFIRINSTLRGPNPLGAYLMVVLDLILAYFISIKFAILKSKKRLALAALFICCLIGLWCSYSRSALLAAAISLILVVILSSSCHLSIKNMKFVAIGLVLLGGCAVLLFTNSYFVSNVLLHENPSEGNGVNSNEGHLSSLISGVINVSRQPFGAGIGSTGSASLLGADSTIIENQYLFVAHEAGWLGLALFLVICGYVMVNLWRARRDWLGLGVFVGGVGLMIIGLMLPVWADDTVSIIWWGLAAVIIGGDYVKSKSQQKSV